LDFITATLHYVALNFISGSVYQMMRGGSIVTTLIFSIIFLKAKVTKNQLAGSALVLVGVFVVGVSNMVFKEKSGDGASEVRFYFMLRDFRLLDTC
jgi:drug/metabolite transporter (DMT)-like permease